MADDDEVLKAQQLANEMANAMAWMTNNNNAAAIADVDAEDSFLRDLSLSEYNVSDGDLLGGSKSFSSPLPSPPLPPPPAAAAAAATLQIPPQMEDFDTDDRSGNGSDCEESHGKSRRSSNSRSASRRSETRSRNGSRSDDGSRRGDGNDGASQSVRGSSSYSSSRSTSSSYSSSRSTSSSYSSSSESGSGSSSGSNSRASSRSHSRSSSSRNSQGCSRMKRGDDDSFRSEEYVEDLSRRQDNDDNGSGNGDHTMDGNQATSGSVDKSLFSESGWSTGRGSSEGDEDADRFFDDNASQGNGKSDEYLDHGSVSYSDSQDSSRHSGKRGRGSNASRSVDDETMLVDKSLDEKSFDDVEDHSEWNSEDGDEKNEIAVDKKWNLEDFEQPSPFRSDRNRHRSEPQVLTESPIMKRLEESEKRAKRLLQHDPSEKRPNSGVLSENQEANLMADATRWMDTTPVDAVAENKSDVGFGSVSFEDRDSSSESSPTKLASSAASKRQDSQPSRFLAGESVRESPVSTRSRSSRQSRQTEIDEKTSNSSFGSFCGDASQNSNEKASVSSRDHSEQGSAATSERSDSAHGSISMQQSVSRRKIKETLDEPLSFRSSNSTDVQKRFKDSTFSPGSKSSRASLQRPPRPRQNESKSILFGSPQPSLGSKGSIRSFQPPVSSEISKDPVELSPFSVDKSTSKASIRSWHSKQSPRSLKSRSGHSSRSSSTQSAESSSSRHGRTTKNTGPQEFDIGSFGNDSFDSASKSSQASDHDERQQDASVNSLSFSRTSFLSSRRSGKSHHSSFSSTSTPQKDRRRGSNASVSERSQRSSQSTGESTSASASTGQDRSTSTQQRSLKSHSSRSKTPSRPTRSEPGSRDKSISRSASRSASQQISRKENDSIIHRRPPTGRQKPSQRNDELRRQTTKLLATVSSIMNVLDDTEVDGSERSISYHKEERRTTSTAARASEFIQSMPELFYFDKCASTLKDLDPGLEKNMTNMHVSVRNSGFQQLVSTAYEMILEVRPRLRYLLSPAEWLHVHLLLLYDRVFDCELRFHNINLDNKFRIDYPDDLPVFESLASILASIGVVQDDSLGITYIPVARPLQSGKKYSPHNPEDVTEFLEWNQLDWKDGWNNVQLGREARRMLAKHEKIKIPELGAGPESKKLDEWEQLAPSLWLGFDADLWFSYKQACFAINQIVRFVPWSKDKKIAGTYAWLLPRQENADGKSFVTLPKRTLTPDTWMMAMVSNFSALPPEHVASWYHKTNPTSDLEDIVGRFLGTSILKPKKDTKER